jgi:deoxyribose-phosphate aldolase
VRVGDIVEHTLLRPEASASDIDRLCDEAARHDLFAVCVAGSWVARCRRRLASTPVQIVSVVGFPTGAELTATKVDDARRLAEAGAHELDMVAAIGRVVGGAWQYVEDDVRAVVTAAGIPVKVIIETAALNPSLIEPACACAQRAGAQFVKTSTGFHPAGGATAEAVAAMRFAVGPSIGVKAAGGIRDAEAAIAMIRAGASRIGTSAGVVLAGVVAA